MNDFDVRACVIDALPNTHAARAFARRWPGRVWLCYYGNSKGKVTWGHDADDTPIVNVNRTEALDTWRDDLHKMGQAPHPADRGRDDRLREADDQHPAFDRGGPRDRSQAATWIKRGPDHFAHADSYAEIALGRRGRLHGHGVGAGVSHG